jgi:hypothetical protein
MADSHLLLPDYGMVLDAAPLGHGAGPELRLAAHLVIDCSETVLHGRKRQEAPVVLRLERSVSERSRPRRTTLKLIMIYMGSLQDGIWPFGLADSTPFPPASVLRWIVWDTGGLFSDRVL